MFNSSITHHISAQSTSHSNQHPTANAAIDEAVAKLNADNPEFTKLHLGGRKINDEDVETLAAATSRSTHLKSIYLQSNNIGDKGAQALAKALGKHSSVTHINLGNNKIGQAGAQALAEGALKD